MNNDCIEVDEPILEIADYKNDMPIDGPRYLLCSKPSSALVISI